MDVFKDSTAAQAAKKYAKVRWNTSKRFMVLESEGELATAYLTSEHDAYQAHHLLMNRLLELDCASLELPIGCIQEVRGQGGVCWDRFIFQNSLAEKILKTLDVCFEDHLIYFKCHVFHPFFDCYRKALLIVDDANLLREQFNSCDRDVLGRAISLFTKFLKLLKSEMASPHVRRLLENYTRNSRDILQNFIPLVRLLGEKRSRLLSLRFDLTYRLVWQGDDGISSEPCLQEAIAHKAKFIRRLDEIFGKGLLLFAWCIERGLLKGLHFHFWVVLDGNLHQQDAVIVNLLGKHWVEDITSGVGAYFNCNAHKDEYYPERMGVGMIDKKKNWEEGIRGVEEIMLYLTKTDFLMRTSLDGVRTFGKSQVRKLRRSSKRSSSSQERGE